VFPLVFEYDPNVGLDVVTLPRIESIVTFPVAAFLIYVRTKTVQFQTPSVYLYFTFLVWGWISRIEKFEKGCCSNCKLRKLMCTVFERFAGNAPDITYTPITCAPLTPWLLVRKRTIPTERPPLVG
jgi:hypothetical protein